MISIFVYQITIKAGDNSNNTVKIIMNIYNNFSDYQTVTYNIAGNQLNNNSVANLKVYANDTAYINNKKVELSNEDLNTIEIANCEFFITHVINNCDNEIFFRSGSFKTKKGFGGRTFETSKKEELTAVLSTIGIKVTEI